MTTHSKNITSSQLPSLRQILQASQPQTEHILAPLPALLNPSPTPQLQHTVAPSSLGDFLRLWLSLFKEG